MLKNMEIYGSVLGAEIEFYDKNEGSNSKHAAKFKKLSKIPTES